MEEDKTISKREELLVIASAIIIAGIAANYSTICPSNSHLWVARGLSKELLDSILDGEKH